LALRGSRKWTVVAVSTIISGLVLYYAVEVAVARIKTTAVVQGVLQSDIIDLHLDDLSRRQIDILLRVEDPNFYSHRGVDLRTPGAGLTTITQALAKNLYFREFRPGIRKIKQTLVARFALHPLVSKDDQLVLFINMHNFCYETRGFSNAARFYYDKDFHSLDEREYIGLVAMFVGCGTFNPIRNPDEHNERVQRIQALISGEYVPIRMRDIYYGDDRHAFKMNYD
jgi:membrane carboxypeptidase/penicillin-binding protein